MHFNRTLIILLLASTLAACANAQPKVQRETAGRIAVYGNWCGPDHPKYLADVTPPAPIDALDAACMRHDQCYDTHGYLACGCDATFTQELREQMAQGRYVGLEFATARAVHAHFAASPCTGDTAGKAAPVRLLRGVYDGGKRRVIEAYERVRGPRGDAAAGAVPSVESSPPPTPVPAQ